MGLRTLVLYILLIFHLEHNFSSVNSRPSSVDTYYESIPLRATKPDVVGFEGKGGELAVVVTKGGGVGLHGLFRWRGGGGGWRGWFGRRRGGGNNGIGGGGGLPGGGGGSTGKGGGGGNGIGGGGGPLKQIPVQTGVGGIGRSRRSSSSRNIGGRVCTVCWLSLLVLTGLLLV